VVAFVDGDCVADPGWLRAMVEPLQGRDRLVVAGDVLVPPEAGWVERFADRVHDQRAAVGFDPPYASTASCSMATAPLRAAGGFDVRFRLSSDVDLSYRLHEQGWSFVHQPAAMVFHPGEESLWALFRLGVRHGRQSISHAVRHAALLRRTGRPRWSWAPYGDVARGAARLARKPSRDGVCELVFVVGKAAGKLSGAVRVRRLVS
jgi:GT2 family glycosyltransferase